MIEKKQKVVMVDKGFSHRNKNRNRNGVFKYILSILKLMLDENKINTIIWITMTIMMAVFPTINVWLSKISIDSINKISINSNYIQKSIIILILIAVINVVYAVMNTISNIIYTKISKEVSFNIQKQLYERLNKIKLEKFEDNVFFNKLLLAQEAIYKNGLDLIKYFFNTIQGILVILGIIYLLWVVHWSLPIAVFMSTIPGLIAIFVGKTKRYSLKWESSEFVRNMGYTSGLFFNKQALKEIRLFKLGNHLIEKWAKLYNDNLKKSINVNIKEEKAKGIGVLILQISNALIGVYLISKISNNQITIGVFVSLTTAVTTIQGSLASIWQGIGEIFEISLATKVLLDILDNDVDDKNLLISNKTIKEIQTIEMKNITFNYPGSDKCVIQNINLSINRGEKVAIVGENGAGKSTLVNIILGLFGSFEGEMLVNGVNIRDIDMSSYNKFVSAVLQDFTKYMYSLRENVAFGDIDKYDDDKLIINTLMEVGLKNKLNDLNLDINTLLSKEYKNGTELSGGEWQKIAIARAMIKTSDLIVLDEPTAALDPLSELEIFELFNKLSEGKTTLMISHRLGITRYADKIIVLNCGKIVEEGRHDELMAYGGVYKKMYESQANWYK